jgi:hypothetical protein
MRCRWVGALVLVAVVACAGKQTEPVAVAVEPEPPSAPPAPLKVRAARKRPPAPVLPTAPIECNRPEQFGPIQLTQEQYMRRHGAGVTDLAALKSSKSRPVEVCHVRGEQDFLLAARCADGTAPFTSAMQVARARSGSVGTGGRCKTIIDLYTVACPEATYEVFMDMHMCPEGSSFR